MKIFWAFLTACAATVISSLLWGWIFHGLSSQGAFFSALIGFFLAVVAFRTCEPAEGRDRRSPFLLEWGLLAIFAIVSFRCFCWLIYPVRDVLCILSPYNLGDISLHIQLIRYFALGAPFWPESPFLSNNPLVYSLGIDVFNAVIVLLGGDLLRSLVWVGGIGAALTAFALWRWGGGFTLAAFLFAGGAMSFSYFFTTGQLDFFQKHVEWKNLFLAMFVTQRGWLYALPAGLALLYEWRREYQKSEGKETVVAPAVPFWLQVGILGTMPLFHVYTFLFLAGVLVSYFLFLSPVQNRPLYLLLVSVLPAAICLWLVTGKVWGGEWLSDGGGWFLRFLPGWLQDGHPWRFWWNNFGILPLLWLILLLHPAVYRDIEARCIFLAASGAFLFCSFFAIAPWPWDNTKLLIWGYLAVTPILWRKVIAPLPFLLKALLCFLLFFSGAVALIGGIRSPGYSLIPLTELYEVESSLKATPPLSRFASATDYNHPLVFNGRKRVIGYEGHLWSHGLPYKPILTKLERLMQGDNDWKSLAHDLHADFLFWGPREEARYPRSKKPWLIQAPVVSRSAYGTIYDLR